MSRYGRVASSDDASMVPARLDEGRFVVDARWGKIQPIEIAPAVRTIGELELIEHLDAGRPGDRHAQGEVPPPGVDRRNDVG